MIVIDYTIDIVTLYWTMIVIDYIIDIVTLYWTMIVIDCNIILDYDSH